jgi:hypothetical protein
MESLDIWAGHPWFREVLWMTYKYSQDTPHFIDGAANHSSCRFFVVSPMFFVVQVYGFVVSCHFVEVNSVQGGPVDIP